MRNLFGIIAKTNRKKAVCFLAVLFTAAAIAVSGCGVEIDTLMQSGNPGAETGPTHEGEQTEFETERSRYFAEGENTVSPEDIPPYDGEPYAVINDNLPFFTEEEITSESFESYSELDELGRCGTVYANVGQDLMPTGEKGSIGQVKPTGWHTVKYDVVNGGYLYNRCHLIGYQLTAENANERNLITGTRYLNVTGMLPFENRVADYVRETNHHVLYRVTPVFDGENLLADGVLMEARSVEDDGEGVCFCVFAYNVQPGVAIDYATGESRLEKDDRAETEDSTEYILNTNTMKFHKPSCQSVEKITEENKTVYVGNREDVTDQGYEPCKACNP